MIKFLTISLLLLSIYNIVSAQSRTEMNKVYDLFRSGESAKLAMRLSELEKKYPDNSEIVHMQGRLLFAAGSYHKAIAKLQRAIKLKDSPKWVVGWSYFYLGICYQKIGHLEKAKAALLTCIKLKATRNCLRQAVICLRQITGKEIYTHPLIGKPAPFFQLADIYGKMHSLADFNGQVIILQIGATWCGGCQQEAARFEQSRKLYEKKNCRFIKISCGEPERCVLDYKKHYRSQALHLISPDYGITRTYMARGWPTTIVIDSKGIIRYHAIGAFFKKHIFKILDAFTTTKDADITCKNGICRFDTGEAESQILETFPSIAASADSRLAVAYTSNQNGNNDIYLKEFRENKWQNQKNVTRESCDDYAATCVIDKKGRIWVAWCSQREKNYDIYARCYEKDGTSVFHRITTSIDDAMSPKLAVALDGKIWITYYKWLPWGTRSRDREIYAKFYWQNKWSTEIRVSPEDVPRYEDHTDPSIIPHKNGAMVVWSWDYHPPKQGNKYDASGPSIFIRTIDNKGKTGKISLVGSLGIRRHCVDLCPSVTLAENKDPIVLWDKAFRLRRYVVARFMSKKTEMFLGGPYQQICSTSLVKAPKSLVALWAAKKRNGHWRIYYSQGKNGEWQSPKFLSQSDGARQHITCDSIGNVWVAFTKKGKVEVHKIKVSK